MATRTFIQPDNSTQTGAQYKQAIDDSFAVLGQIGGQFAPHAKGTPDMTVLVDAGRMVAAGAGALVSQNQQTVSGFVATASTQRIDRIVGDKATGAASRIAGVESATPVAPAIPVGKFPIAQVGPFTTSTAAISNSMIGDERSFLLDPFFESATAMVFAQTSAPVGWTKSITHNDKALRIVSGAASSGGSNSFTTVFGAGKTTAGFSLTINEMPGHSHNFPYLAQLNGGGGGANLLVSGSGNIISSPVGNGASHAHSLTLDLQYVDAIIATKD